VTEAVIAALRAYVAGFPAGQAGIDRLISHGGFLTRPGFRRFADTFTCVSDGTPTAQIGWQSVHTAWHEGHLPLSGGKWRILKIAASPAAGTGVSLRDTPPRPRPPEPGTSDHSHHPARRRTTPRTVRVDSRNPRPRRPIPAGPNSTPAKTPKTPHNLKVPTGQLPRP
jgi:hypothetical protein